MASATQVGVGPELWIDIVAAAEQGTEKSDLFSRRFRCGAVRTDSLGPVARAQDIQCGEVGLEATEFVTRQCAFPIEGTQFGTPSRDLGAERLPAFLGAHHWSGPPLILIPGSSGRQVGLMADACPASRFAPPGPTNKSAAFVRFCWYYVPP